MIKATPVNETAEEALQKSLKEAVIQNKEKKKRANELVIANIELAFQNKEKEKRAAELIIANKELLFQNEEKEKRAEEKEKRAEELIIANKELAFQNKEKEKRAAELGIANIELAFQNEEKEKRAAELVVANKELLFQNKEKEKRAEEKEKRAEELVVANKELAFQNKEKEKRAAELGIANIELAFQNEEKEKRAQELIIANKELIFQNREKEKQTAELIIANRDLITTEEQLKAVNQELESFSYSISHDLRAPLRSINGYAKIIEEDYAGLFDDEGRRLLNVVQDNAKKMGVLIDDLLAFSRLGRKEIHKSLINMTLLAENVLAELNTISNFKTKVTINNLHPVMADHTLMKQVWMNLLSNAIKYSSTTEKPAVVISSEEKDGKLIYSITDNGVGFDMQYAHKLFGVFQRLHSAEDFEGTGVGLALVQRIIIKQGGTIWAQAAIGKGATFYFSLPQTN